MASAPQLQLPLFYNDLTPLNSRDHGKWVARSVDKAKWVANQHAIPVTVDEFVMVQRDYPIVFSDSETPVPLGLMGLNEGVNVFFDAEGELTAPNTYVPAYVRRYPFMLAKLTPEAQELSLCFDPTSELIVEEGEGAALFDADQPSEHTRNLLGFCEQFEQSGMRTQEFVQELMKHDLLMDGEVGIQRNEVENPYVYRGFKMVNQEKLAELRGDQLRTWNQNGILALIHAHLFSLDLMRVIFAMQIDQGKGPIAANGSAQTGNLEATA